jgi:anti-sigma factor RsiW
MAMTCREFADFIADYFEGELAEGVRARFERHLERCENCRRYLAQYRSTAELGRVVLAREAAPVDAPEELVRAILASISL